MGGSSRGVAALVATSLSACTLLVDVDVGVRAQAGEDAGPDGDGNQQTLPDASWEPGPFHLEDSLRGTTSGHLVGGMITPTGWRVIGRQNRIWWSIPPLAQGSIEFTVTGMSNTTDPNMVLTAHEIFSLYEAGYDLVEPVVYYNTFRNNYYKAVVWVHGNDATAGQQQMDWINCAGGYPGYSDDAVCPCSNAYFNQPVGGEGTWDGTDQRIRIEWTGSGAALRRNGVEVVAHTWSDDGSFAPLALHLSLGTSRGTAIADAGLPIGAVFSDLVVDGMIEAPTAACPP